MDEFNDSLAQYFDRAHLYESSELGRRAEVFEAVSSSSAVGEFAALEERYEDGGCINEGGLKRILECRDLATGRIVAKAVLKKAADAAAVEQFLREGRITASLQHPNIVPVYDIGLDGDLLPYFTMKLIEGDSLREIVGKLREGNRGYCNRYTLPVLVDIFLKICDAVAYAHSRGILHLDLKPDNIRVGEFGGVLVCDWGLARKIDAEELEQESDGRHLEGIEDAGFTLDGEIKGTPGYMAPEQASGSTEERSKRTDIYALGAILYALLAQRTTGAGD